MEKRWRMAASGICICFCIMILIPPAWSGNLSESDENGDGKIDQWFEDLGDDRFKVSMDRDFDGRIDYSLIYRSDGHKEYEELDYKYDGEMDDFYYYRAGVLERRSVDTNYDGREDLWVFLREGVYVWKVERDEDHDGKIDYMKEYGPPPA